MSSAFTPIRRALMPSLLWAGTAVWAQAPASGALVRADEALPSRLALCQRELGSTKSEDRQRLLRACLLRRLEGERIVERSCRRQVAGAGAGAERQQAQRACERQALAVSSAELPKPPPPAPRPVPALNSDGAGASAGTPPAADVTARKPAAGEF